MLPMLLLSWFGTLLLPFPGPAPRLPQEPGPPAAPVAEAAVAPPVRAPWRPKAADLLTLEQARASVQRLQRREKGRGSGLTTGQWGQALADLTRAAYGHDEQMGGLLGTDAMPMTRGRAADFNAEADKAGKNRIYELIERCKRQLQEGGCRRAFDAELAAVDLTPRVLFLPHACILRIEGKDGPTFTNVYDGRNQPDAMCQDLVLLGAPWSLVQLQLHDRLFHYWKHHSSVPPIGQSFHLQHVLLALADKHAETMRALRKMDEAGDTDELPALARRVAPLVQAYLASTANEPKNLDLAREHFLTTKQRLDLPTLQAALWMLYQVDKFEAAVAFALFVPKRAAATPTVLRPLVDGDFGDWVRLLAATEADLATALRGPLDEAAREPRIGDDLAATTWSHAGGPEAILAGEAWLRGNQTSRRRFVADWIHRAQLVAGVPAEQAASERDAITSAREGETQKEAVARAWAAAGRVAADIVHYQLLRNRILASEAFLLPGDRTKGKGK